MEPVTHILTGAVLARAGVHRRTAHAMLAMAIAAEFPDIDTVWSLGGALTGFEHHRGITHTFLALPVEAGLITLGFVLFARLRRPPRRPPRAPLRWGWLYAGTLLALLSHLLLDWTNNYGVRPFFPFNPRWYAGSFVFIVEPVLLAILLAALLLPPLFGLIDAEVGAGRQRFVSRGWSYVALVLIAALYGLRWQQRHRALAIAAQVYPSNSSFASPYPLHPLRWAVITQGRDSIRLWTMTLSQPGTSIATHLDSTLYQPVSSPAIAAAKQTRLGRLYLDWSMFPVLDETPDNSDPHHPLTRVTFADARFVSIAKILPGRRGPAPLSGSVLLDMQAPPEQRVVETVFEGRVQR